MKKQGLPLILWRGSPRFARLAAAPVFRPEAFLETSPSVGLGCGRSA
jgi:hypothetical protein